MLVTVTLALFGLARGLAQEKPLIQWDVKSLSGKQGAAIYNFLTQTATATEGVLVRYGDAVLTAERAALDYKTGEVIADGDVRIQQGGQFYTSQHVRYNFLTHQLQAEEFRTGETPVFAAGEGLSGDLTNHVYTATHSRLTTDDEANPEFYVRARRIVIIPGKKVKAYDAVLYVKGVPVFYFPYYSRNIGPRSNNFNFLPGYRTLFGPFILSDYTWYPNDDVDVIMHLDYRQKRGPSAGRTPPSAWVSGAPSASVITTRTTGTPGPTS
jgi:LPS-assembly protein